MAESIIDCFAELAMTNQNINVCNTTTKGRDEMSNATSSAPTPNINNLITAATNDGTISAEASQVLSGVDLGAGIQSGLNPNLYIDDIATDEVFLVALLIDDSGSIRMASNADIVRTGHNLVVEALRESKGSGGIYIHTRYLNGTVLYPFSEVKDAALMDTHNYNPNGGTPLYDETLVILKSLMAEAQRLKDEGNIHVRTATLIVSDGADCHSMRRAADVKKVVDDILRAEDHIVAAMGISDGSTDFRAVFTEMGVRDTWILTPGNTKSEIRKAFGRFSQSAVRASQGKKSFSQTAMAGFGS